MSARSRLTCALLLAALTPASSAAQPSLLPTPTLGPAIERCRSFCATIYGTGTAEQAQCAAACGDADACSQRCAVRFPAEEGKRTMCLKRCMDAQAAPR